MATPYFHTTTGAEVAVVPMGGGMRFRPQERMSYAKRLALHAAAQAEKAQLIESKRCLKGFDTDSQCKGYRTNDSIYCQGHKVKAERDGLHEDFPEGVLIDPELKAKIKARGAA